METLKTIETILETFFTAGGAVLALWIYLHDKRRETIKNLAEQVIAYNALEQEYLAVLQNQKDTPQQSIQTEMRKRAVENEKNTNMVYPDMTPSKARSYSNLL